MFSTILTAGPIWGEVVGSMLGKALLIGSLTVIKAGPQIQKIVNNMTIEDEEISKPKKEVSNKSEVIDVFNCTDNK